MAPRAPAKPAARAWHNAASAESCGTALLAYFVAMMAARYHLRGPYGLADAVWGCNVAILMAGVGLKARSRTLVATAINVVALPHFMWWIDVAVAAVTGSFPLGSAEYITWEATSRLELATTTHHVWFVPLCLYFLRGNGGMPWSSVLYSILTTAVIGAMGLLFPKEVVLPDGTPFYLNVNMAHEFWNEVRGGWKDWYHICDPPAQPLWVYQIWLNTAGIFSNFPIQGMWVVVSRAMEPAKKRAKKE